MLGQAVAVERRRVEVADAAGDRGIDSRVHVVIVRRSVKRLPNGAAPKPSALTSSRRAPDAASAGGVDAHAALLARLLTALCT